MGQQVVLVSSAFISSMHAE